MNDLPTSNSTELYTTATAYAAGNVTSQATSGTASIAPASRALTYDALYRLTNHDATGSSLDTFWQYDAAGNWTSTDQNSPGSAVSLTANSDNEYTAVGGESPVYDANGRLWKTNGDNEGSWRFYYDEFAWSRCSTTGSFTEP